MKVIGPLKFNNPKRKSKTYCYLYEDGSFYIRVLKLLDKDDTANFNKYELPLREFKDKVLVERRSIYSKQTFEQIIGIYLALKAHLDDDGND